jgi:hypothetical protein
MNDFLSSFLNKISKKVSRRKTTKWNKNQIKLDLLKLEERLVPAPNLLVPTTTSGAPLGFVAGTNLAFSGALDIELLDTPTPTSTGSFTTTVAATAGTASATASGAAAVTGSGTNSLSISGSLADVNATLNSLTYTNSTTGAASLVVTARDSASTALTDSKSIFVLASNSGTAPTITSTLADVSYEAETATTPVARATIPVVVTDPQGTAGLTVSTTNDNPALINGITVAGTTPNFTLAITTKTGITGTAVVTVKVSDGTNFTTKSFKVTVTPPAFRFSAFTIAGNNSGTTTGTQSDGTGSAAEFKQPRGGAADNRGLIYILDGSLIRSVSTSGVVTTLAGSRTISSRVDGIGTAARITEPMDGYVCSMGVSPDNNWLYFYSNGDGWFRKMGINPSDSANYLKVTSLVLTPLKDNTGVRPGIGAGNMVFTSDGQSLILHAPDGSPAKPVKLDLATNTFSNITVNNDPTLQILPRWVTQGPNNTAFMYLSRVAAFPSITAGLYQMNLATNMLTRIGNYVVDPTDTDGGGASAVYNPVSNTLLVTPASSGPAYVLDATNGALVSRFGGSSALVNGAGGNLVGNDGLAVSNGVFYATGTSFWNGGGTATRSNFRAGVNTPGLFNPGSVSFTEGQANYFDNMSLEKMGVKANGYTSITYRLTALYGTLDVSTVSGLTGVTGRGSKSLSFTGSEADLNAALATLAYTPDAGYINASTTGVAIAGVPGETLTASASDSSSPQLATTGSISVLVKALNNAPRIITPLANQNYVADTTQKTEPVINFTIADADTAASSFTNNATTGARITVTSSNPNLFLPASMATAIGGSNNARTLTLKHEAGITGSATVTITINDGTNQNIYTFRVTVTPNPFTLAISTLAGRTTSSAPTGYTDGTGSTRYRHLPGLCDRCLRQQV